MKSIVIHFHRTLVAFAALAVLLSGAAAHAADGLAAAVWPMLGVSPQHNSLSTFQGPATNKLAWHFDTNAVIAGGVAIDVDGTTFFGSGNGRFFAVDQTGHQRWSIGNLTPVVGVPALARGGKIYIATTNGSTGTLFAVDVATGQQRWVFDTLSPITASPAVGSDGTIYVTTRSKGLYAVSPQGKQVWKVAAIDRMEGSSPAIGANGVIYVGTVTGRVVAVTPAGFVMWQSAVTKDALGTPTIAANRLYIGSADGFVRALDPATGNVLWAFRIGSAVGSGLSVGGDGTLFFGAADQKIYALRDAGTQGQLVWATLVGGVVGSTPAVDRTGAVFVGSDDHNVYALEPDTGARRWSFATGGAVQSAIAIGVGGRVFAGSNDRSLYAIGEFRSGADCWSDAFIDPTGLTPDELARRFQTLLAACGGPNINACQATVQGEVNGDRLVAAVELASQRISPAQYLAILWDRTRKLDALTANSAAMCDVVAHDADGDLIPDSVDACAATPQLTPTLDNGCTDTTLPPAPSANLVQTALSKMNLLLNPTCDETVPGIPSITLTAVTFSGVDFAHPASKELWFSLANNLAPGCDVFIEMEVFYRSPTGAIETYYLVFPRAAGISKGTRTVAFTTKSGDADPYGAFTRSGAFVTINNAGAVTQYRLRATNYSGVRPPWGPLICDSCQVKQ